MQKTGFFHHVGSFLLFAAFILALITTITSPVVGDIAILKVNLGDFNGVRQSSVTFGTFGYCLFDSSPDGAKSCTPKTVGYDLADVMAAIEGPSFSTTYSNTANRLTKVMVLHPIVCVMAFVAFLMTLGAGVCGSLMASLTAGLAWVLSVIVLATDLVAFNIVRNSVNDDLTASYAFYSSGMWTLLAAMICLFFATFIVFFTCCSARMHRRSDRTSKVDPAYAPTASRMRFFRRGRAY